MTKRLFGTVAVALALVGVALAAETSGLPKGSEVPTIHIDAFNDNRGEFCVTCEAGRKPAVVAFVSKADDATKKLMAALNKSFVDNKSKRLYAGIIILGNGDAAKTLKAYAQNAKLTIPTAHVTAATDEIKQWKLNSKVASTTFLIDDHKVQRNAANLPAAQVAAAVKAIME
ncbi:MAG: hypothetical protein IT204_25880 [Fimbriimonadaceae bacterium]|nr:hypothetical protein [Fimbriimonadaceae bacterium]